MDLIEYISVKPFKSLSSLKDLSNYVNELETHLASQNLNKNLLLSERRLRYIYAQRNTLYRSFEIAKKSGKKRIIDAPNFQLKKIQGSLALILSSQYELYIDSIVAHGFRKGKSIISNASPHISKKYVLNVDIKDFFPTIHFGRVKSVLKLSPYFFQEKMAHIIANLCVKDGKLPQGAPTSPVLTNIICWRLDHNLYNLAKEKGCEFTRYADDMTFSSNENVFNGNFFKEMNKIVKNEGFRFNIPKTRLIFQSGRQEVTGIIVNEKLNLSRIKINEIRAALNNWDKKGIDECQLDFVQKYKGKPNVDFRDWLWGKLIYLKMVRGEEDLLTIKYMDQYIQLIKRKS